MARGAKYSRIIQAAKLKAGVDNLIKYWEGTTTRGSRIGTGDARPDPKFLWIDPFALALATGQRVKQSCFTTAFAAHGAAMNGFVDETAPSDSDLVIRLANYSAARAVFTTGRLEKGVREVSKVTGLPYASYKGKSLSIPFGQKVGATTPTAAFNAIRTAKGSFNGTIALKPEKFQA